MPPVTTRPAKVTTTPKPKAKRHVTKPKLKPKPSLAAYRLPIWLPSTKHGSHVAVWGQLRAASHSGHQKGQIQFRRKGSSKWTTLHQVSTTNTQGFFSTHVAIGSPGFLRLSWTSSTHKTYYGRTVSVR